MRGKVPADVAPPPGCTMVGLGEKPRSTMAGKWQGILRDVLSRRSSESHSPLDPHTFTSCADLVRSTSREGICIVPVCHEIATTGRAVRTVLRSLFRVETRAVCASSLPVCRPLRTVRVKASSPRTSPRAVDFRFVGCLRLPPDPAYCGYAREVVQASPASSTPPLSFPREGPNLKNEGLRGS